MSSEINNTLNISELNTKSQRLNRLVLSADDGENTLRIYGSPGDSEIIVIDNLGGRYPVNVTELSRALNEMIEPKETDEIDLTTKDYTK